MVIHRRILISDRFVSLQQDKEDLPRMGNLAVFEDKGIIL